MNVPYAERVYWEQRASRAIGDRVHDLRLAAGITRNLLAEHIGTNGPAIRRLERGGHMPKLGTLHAIACALGCDIQQILSALPAKETT